VRRTAFCAWSAALAALVLYALWLLWWQPDWMQAKTAAPPPSDLPVRADVRLVGWESRLTVRATDRLLEVMNGHGMPFAVSRGDILRQAAFETRQSIAAIVVTLEGRGPTAGELPTFLSSGWGRVDDVPMNKSDQLIAVGSRVWVASPLTSVTRRGMTTVVERPEWMRALRAGGRYLMFLWGDQHTSMVPEVRFGNTFEMRGQRTVLMTFANREDWRCSADTSRLLHVVRSRRHLPSLVPGEADRLGVLAQ
jgi:hypothetical protein